MADLVILIQKTNNVIGNILILFIFFLFVSVKNTSASTSENDNYIFRLKMNYFQNQGQSNNYKAIIPDIHITISPEIITPHTSVTNRIPAFPPVLPKNSIELGYSEGYSLYSFTISDILIDYGPLSPTNPITRSNYLSINSNSLLPIQILAIENHQLSNGKGSIIPNTTCDNGTCTPSHASSWNSTLTYGLGYQCKNIFGLNCTDNYLYSGYRQFADESINNPYKNIITGYIIKKGSSRINYKINVPGNQNRALYTNTITYISIPSL